MALPDVEKAPVTVDKYEVVDDELVKVKAPGAMGTVTISDTKDVIMVPTPSSDPRGTAHHLSETTRGC